MHHKQDGSICSGLWQGWATHMTCSWHMSIHGKTEGAGRPGRPRHTWLRTLKANLRPLNHGHARDWGRLWKQLCCSLEHAHDNDNYKLHMFHLNSKPALFITEGYVERLYKAHDKKPTKYTQRTRQLAIALLKWHRS